jgi:hypothetical protein
MIFETVPDVNLTVFPQIFLSSEDVSHEHINESINDITS